MTSSFGGSSSILVLGSNDIFELVSLGRFGCELLFRKDVDRLGDVVSDMQAEQIGALPEGERFMGPMRRFVV
jgi:hypothetical protein